MQSKVFSTNKTLNIGGRLLDLTVPKVMGILNVTPDSFFDGGRYENQKAAITQTGRMLEEGADIIDVGGYSTRPGAEDISDSLETTRVVETIRTLLREFPATLISVDTFRSSVARAAVNAGALMINDVSGGELDPKMFETVAALQVPYVLMHMRGTPQTMNQLTKYDNLIKDSVDYFHKKIRQLQDLKVKDIIVDPGFGFAKSVEQNFELLDQLPYFTILGKPILAGLSRKSMIWRTLETNADGALNGTTALNTIALTKGASILRVHDVAEAVESIRLISKIKKENNSIQLPK